MKKLKIVSFLLACTLFSTSIYAVSNDNKEIMKTIDHMIRDIQGTTIEEICGMKYRMENVEPQDLINHDDFIQYIASFKDSFEKLKKYRFVDNVTSIIFYGTTVSPIFIYAKCRKKPPEIVLNNPAIFVLPYIGVHVLFRFFRKKLICSISGINYEKAKETALSIKKLVTLMAVKSIDQKELDHSIEQCKNNIDQNLPQI